MLVPRWTRDVAVSQRPSMPKTPPEITKKLRASAAGMVIPGSPLDFGNLIADETEKWGK
jgi:hypothetical protein